jgi:sugar O-acyltransferase (sialic acid O-acetyltransferase NeuD family)
LEEEGKYHVAGLVDSVRSAGELVFGYVILGAEKDFAALAQKCGCNKVIVAIGDNYQRQAASERLVAAVPELQFVSTVHPSAVVSKRATLGRGCVLMAGVIINAGTVLADGCLVNTRASIDHDCQLSAFSSVAPGAVLAGAVRVGVRTSIGLGATVRQGVAIGPDTVIGAGATVTRDIPDLVVAYGLPCEVVSGRGMGDPYL